MNEGWSLERSEGNFRRLHLITSSTGDQAERGVYMCVMILRIILFLSTISNYKTLLLPSFEVETHSIVFCSCILVICYCPSIISITLTKLIATVHHEVPQSRHYHCPSHSRTCSSIPKPDPQRSKCRYTDNYLSICCLDRGYQLRHPVGENLQERANQ